MKKKNGMIWTKRNSVNMFFDKFIKNVYCLLTGRLDWRFYHTDNVYIGTNCHIGVGVCLVNGQPSDFEMWKEDIKNKGYKKKIIINDECFIGSNSVICSGVELGKHTIVGAGSVVRKSFKEGYCIVCGNPARLIRRL